MRVLSVVFVVSAAYLKHAGIVVRLPGHRSRHPARQQVLAAMVVGCRHPARQQVLAAMGVGCRHPARQQVLAAMSRECPYFRKISRVVRVLVRRRSLRRVLIRIGTDIGQTPGTLLHSHLMRLKTGRLSRFLKKT